MSKFIGIVSAYAYAVSQGYSGTEDEFAQLMADYASVGQSAAQSAEQASASATSASQSADTASASAQTAQTAQQTASTKASEASASATNAQTAQGLAESARDDAIDAKTDAESARDLAQQYADSIDPDNIFSAYATDTASGAVASFADGADDIPMKSVKVAIEPVQDLHGYDHPWPAGGGKNKFRNTATTQTVNGVTFTVNSDGTVSCSGTATATAVLHAYLTYSDLPQGESLILNGCPSGGGFTTTYGQALCNSLGVVLDGKADSGNGVTYTTTDLANLAQLQIVIRSGVNANGLVFKPMIRLSSVTDATYAPCSNICPITGWTGCEIKHSGADTSNPTTYPITFPTEAGTVYGAYVDVTGGELVVDRAQIASYNGEALPSTWISDRDVYASGTTPTIGAQVVYKLVEPIHYPLTPQEIKTLYGQNNLWADTGDTEVEYRASTKMYIDKKITEAVASALNS